MPQSEYTTYIVKWYESLDDVAQKFGIPKDKLMYYNSLKTEKLSRRQELKIPNDPSSIVIPSAPKESRGEVSISVDSLTLENLAAALAASQGREITPTASKQEQDRDASPKKKGRKTISTADEQIVPTEQTTNTITDSVDLDSSTDDEDEDEEETLVKFQNKIDLALVLPFGAGSGSNFNDSAYDFYAGALLAAKDLEDVGIKTHMTVIDSRTDRLSWLDMLTQDLIIGPITPKDLDSLRSYTPDKVAIVSPLDPKGLALAQEYPNIIQAPTPTTHQNDELVKWIKEDMTPEDRLIVLHEKGAAPTPILSAIKDAGLPFSELSYGILEGRDAIEAIEKIMTPTGVNRVVVASDQEAFVNDAVRNANLMTHRTYNVALYGTSKIRTFETVEAESLHNTHAHIVCGYYVDYESERVKNFITRYRALFKSEPTPFAFQGYDTTWYFVSSWATTERLSKRLKRLSDDYARGLQSDFSLTKVGKGYANSAIRRIIYQDGYSISLQ